MTEQELNFLLTLKLTPEEIWRAIDEPGPWAMMLESEECS